MGALIPKQPLFNFQPFVEDVDRDVTAVAMKLLPTLGYDKPLEDDVRLAEERLHSIRMEHSSLRADVLEELCRDTGASPLVGMMVIVLMPHLADHYAAKLGLQDEAADLTRKMSMCATRALKRINERHGGSK